MNKLKIVTLSILGGIERAFYIFTPMLIVALWLELFGIEKWSSYFIFGIGTLSMIFRAIKVGWMK